MNMERKHPKAVPSFNEDSVQKTSLSNFLYLRKSPDKVLHMTCSRVSRGTTFLLKSKTVYRNTGIIASIKIFYRFFLHKHFEGEQAVIIIIVSQQLNVLKHSTVIDGSVHTYYLCKYSDTLKNYYEFQQTSLPILNNIIGLFAISIILQMKYNIHNIICFSSFMELKQRDYILLNNII
ncbi:hypothetical protein E2986_10811 [Frieseomelitta varia]|uniref:Uncharacterized protein n=1 Tax=Frieseomelitta varia TaxID=561572 RepID=A0A833RCL1_9HYME|nr:hypothetical protein E2986_10811 [Frieseomelitta varia]